MNTSSTYYDLLGVNTDASEEEIQQAYRDLVRETHPDINSDPSAREQMVKLTKAREVLTDSQKRAEYDAEQNIEGRNTQEASHTTAGGESASSQTQYRDSSRDRQRRDHQSTRRSTTRNGGRTTGTDTHSTARAQTRSRRERNRRTHTRTRTRTQTSQTASESGSIGTVPLRVYVRYLYDQRGRLFREGYGRAIVFLFNFCTLSFLWSLNRKRINSFLTSPTVLRLAAAFGLWWVIDWGIRQLDSTVFGEGGVLLIGLCLFGSYLGHDLLKEYTDLIGEPLSERFHSIGNIRFWLVIGANLFALGLFFWGVSTGAPTGGIALGFTFVVTLPIFTLVFGMITTAVLFAIGANASQTILEKGLIYGPVIGLVMSLAALFTPAFSPGGIGSVFADVPPSLTTHPWISPQLVGQVGPVYAGLMVNALIGGLMLGSWLWSLLAVCRLLTKVPWNDRFERGYRIRPGFWNFIAMLPFVIFTWMLVHNIPFVSLSIGNEAVSFTINNLLYLFWVLPIVLASFYVVRRHAELWIRNTS